MSPKPCVYLIHFSDKFGHARHYVGYSDYLEARFAHHKAGTGSRLLRAVNLAGIDYVIAAVYVGADRTFERKLHDSHQTAAYCPICAAESGKEPRTFKPCGYIVTKPKSRAYKNLTAVRWQAANLYESCLKPWQLRAVIESNLPLVPARALPESGLPF